MAKRSTPHAGCISTNVRLPASIAATMARLKSAHAAWCSAGAEGCANALKLTDTNRKEVLETYKKKLKAEHCENNKEV